MSEFERPWKALPYSFPRQETKAQRGAGTCLRSHSNQMLRQGAVAPFNGEISHFPTSGEGAGRP